MKKIKEMEEKDYWEMSLQELVEEWGDTDMSKYDERQGYPMPQHQRDYYLWKALARDIQEIKNAIKLTPSKPQ